MRYLFRVMIIFKPKEKYHCEKKSISCKHQPDSLPVFYAIHRKVINCHATQNRANPCADTIYHGHKEPLRAGTNAGINFLFDKYRTRNIEEIECTAINNHRQQQQNKPGWWRISISEETKAQRPGHHTHHHDGFDAKTLQKERNRQNETDFSHLWNWQ